MQQSKPGGTAVLKSAIALSALFMCAFASPAVAQNTNCNVPLFTPVPSTCSQAEVDARRQGFYDRNAAQSAQSRAREDLEQERDYYRSRYNGGWADRMEFGRHPGPMGTYNGYPVGRAGQCDRSSGCTYNYGYNNDGSYFYGGDTYYGYGAGWYYNRRGVYIYPYAEEGVDMHVPPEPPKDVYVGGGRGWKCRHLERAWMCRVGSTKGEKAFAYTAIGAVAIYLLAR